MNNYKIPSVCATPDNTHDYGIFIGTDVPSEGPNIPFYTGSVQEGYNLPFEYNKKAVVRTAKIHPRPNRVIWLERHMKMTQLFLGLGDSPFALVLGRPNHHLDEQTPSLREIKTFVFPPGHGIILHLGTWHDFPLAIKKSVTVFTVNSEEVVQALTSQSSAEEMNQGDVYKIDIFKRMGINLYTDRLEEIS